MVFARAEPVKNVLLIRRNVRRLQQHQIESGECTGAWNYGDAGRGDNSNSQFALLALHEAEALSMETGAGDLAAGLCLLAAVSEPRRVVGLPASDCGLTLAGRTTSIAWPGTGSMTCAGVTSLVIAADRVRPATPRPKATASLAACPTTGTTATKIDRGLEWLGSHFSVARNPGHGLWRLYYLYGLERAGRLTARRFLSLPAPPPEPSGGPIGIARGRRPWSRPRIRFPATGPAPAPAKTSR